MLQGPKLSPMLCEWMLQLPARNAQALLISCIYDIGSIAGEASASANAWPISYMYSKRIFKLTHSCVIILSFCHISLRPGGSIAHHHSCVLWPHQDLKFISAPPTHTIMNISLHDLWLFTAWFVGLGKVEEFILGSCNTYNVSPVLLTSLD